MYICIYIHMYIYMHTYIYFFTYIHTHIYIYIHAHIYIFIIHIILYYICLMSKIYLCFEIQPPSENDLDQDVKPLEEKAIVRVEGMESFTHCDVAPGRHR